MPIKTHYTCLKCQEEIEVEVVINEEDDLPECCPECGTAIPDKAHEDMQQQAVEKAYDNGLDD
jgi:DNA-directed RNA polymerase subunit RPC12/RpoP